jgi:hypothetical protein
MLTLESKFSEFIKMFVDRGACASASVYTAELTKDSGEEDPTLAITIATYEKEPNKNDAFISWAIIKFGKEIEEKLRERYIATITDMGIAMKIYSSCDFLTTSERGVLESIYKGKLNSIVIKEPMEAARLYIDYAPILTKAESLSLKAVFKGKLPTVEKELKDGTVTRATAEVKP